MIDDLKRAVLDALGPRPTAARRREVADALNDLAAEQRRIAGAVARQGGRPPAERAVIRKPHAGPGRDPGTLVRIDDRYDRLTIHIGRAIYYQWRAERVFVERRDGHVCLVPSADGDYQVDARAGIAPRIVCTRMMDVVALDAGYYAATIRTGNVLELLDPVASG